MRIQVSLMIVAIGLIVCALMMISSNETVPDSNAIRLTRCVDNYNVVRTYTKECKALAQEIINEANEGEKNDY